MRLSVCCEIPRDFMHDDCLRCTYKGHSFGNVLELYCSFINIQGQPLSCSASEVLRQSTVSCKFTLSLEKGRTDSKPWDATTIEEESDNESSSSGSEP